MQAPIMYSFSSNSCMHSNQNDSLKHIVSYWIREKKTNSVETKILIISKDIIELIKSYNKCKV